MKSRRHFLQDIAALSGAGLAASAIFEPIQKALAIDPEEGSTFLDAEHVVILMQENRSFDHAFGTLKGVRGFNDPRAIELANGNPVWAQSNAKGETYIPFRLDIKESKTTWTGCLPHGWDDQVDAANGGKHDRWLDTKRSGAKEYASMPLTLGYHTRKDIPFYYALADAFTICDQNFCSTLTGTTPNRLHLWTGTIREKPDPKTPALVRNEDCDYGSWVNWTTFPERLEDHGISWKIYQNELTVPSGLTAEADAWLGNFGDNPIEWFTQYGVCYSENHRKHREKASQTLGGELKGFDKASRETFSAENFEKLSPREKSIHARAFTTNAGDPAYRELREISYREGDKTYRLNVPKGDILYQFRKDVNDGTLPTVSWLVPPERFSDHPCSAWYGQWYLSEVLSILTKNPEVWKKTIFILTYDENDGYFDHVPPFQAPHPNKPESGLASKGLDTTLEHLELEVDRKHKPNGAARGNSLGLGFRVPMLIASPWSRGGFVYSEVTDHTSPIQFLERFLSQKTGKKVEEPNISAWRRAICGDLTASFQAYFDEESGLDKFLARDAFLEAIHRARFKNPPTGFHPLTEKEIADVRTHAKESLMPKQELGTRESCPLPYELFVDGELNKARTHFKISLKAGNAIFGDRAAGAPFIVYAKTAKGLTVRHYAVVAGTVVEDLWPLEAFPEGAHQLRVYGPNGFFREFTGDKDNPQLEIAMGYFQPDPNAPQLSGDVRLVVTNKSSAPVELILRDQTYGRDDEEVAIAPGEEKVLVRPSAQDSGWYDYGVTVKGASRFLARYAGRVETGRFSISDPYMGFLCGDC
jgi:phospholipase C